MKEVGEKTKQVDVRHESENYLTKRALEIYQTTVWGELNVG